MECISRHFSFFPDMFLVCSRNKHLTLAIPLTGSSFRAWVRRSCGSLSLASSRRFVSGRMKTRIPLNRNLKCSGHSSPPKSSACFKFWEKCGEHSTLSGNFDPLSVTPRDKPLWLCSQLQKKRKRERKKKKKRKERNRIFKTKDKGQTLPKFRDWDVNDAASAEGFTMIFNKARDEKKFGANPSSPRKDESLINHSADPGKHLMSSPAET